MYGDESDAGCDCHFGVCADGEGLVRYEPCNTDIGCRMYIILVALLSSPKIDW